MLIVFTVVDLAGHDMIDLTGDHILVLLDSFYFFFSFFHELVHAMIQG